MFESVLSKKTLKCPILLPFLQLKQLAPDRLTAHENFDMSFSVCILPTPRLDGKPFPLTLNSCISDADLVPLEFFVMPESLLSPGNRKSEV